MSRIVLFMNLAASCLRILKSKEKIIKYKIRFFELNVTSGYLMVNYVLQSLSFFLFCPSISYTN